MRKIHLFWKPTKQKGIFGTAFHSFQMELDIWGYHLYGTRPNNTYPLWSKAGEGLRSRVGLRCGMKSPDLKRYKRLQNKCIDNKTQKENFPQYMPAILIISFLQTICHNRYQFLNSQSQSPSLSPQKRMLYLPNSYSSPNCKFVNLNILYNKEWCQHRQSLKSFSQWIQYGGPKPSQSTFNQQ